MTATIEEKSEQAVEGQEDRLSRRREFLESIRELYTKDQGNGRGRLAMLRRNAGETMTTARNIAWFYRYLAPCGGRTDAENIHLLVASLMAFDKKALERGLNGSGDLGSNLRAIAKPQSKQGEVEPAAARRLVALLDSTFDTDGGGEMAYRLRQTVKFMLSREGRIHWPQLLDDLLNWNRPDKRVQKRWARSFYNVQDTSNTAVAIETPLTTDTEE